MTGASRERCAPSRPRRPGQDRTRGRCPAAGCFCYAPPVPGTLYVVATPIGNVEDVTLRALRALAEVDLIAAEDTRRTRILLEAHGIRTPVTSYYDAVERERAPRLAAELAA